jgi:hypothetical protein
MPTLGDAPSLEDEVWDAAAAQMLTHRHPGLARADDKSVYLFDPHFVHPFYSKQ